MEFTKQIVGGCCFVWLILAGAAYGQPVGRGSTVEGDIARGQGAFLSGVGWYNLRNAQAASINVDSTIRWKADLRKIQQEARELEAQKKYAKNKNIEQVRAQIAQREKELRLNPSPADVQSGAALNALIYDLTDPDITSSQWRNATAIALPSGTSVKELIFRFTPHKISTQASAALSRGVIALSRLDIKDKWHVLLTKDELAKERKAYEDAYVRVRDKVLKGQYAVDEILALDAALDALKKKIATEIPTERGFRTEANKFVDDLREATRMFDANSVDYAREILIDTKDHDATNVEELVAFMTKYRLQFSNSDRSPAARVLYGQLYEKLREQAEQFGQKPDVGLVTSGFTASASAKRSEPALVKKFPELPRGSGKMDKDAPKSFTKTDSGLQYRILRGGNAKTPTAGDRVEVNYHGWLENGKVFDSSYEKGKSISFPLSGVVKGWSEGLQLVGEGGMIELVIPPDLGYGARGAGSAVPANATLNFVVELLKVQ